MIRHFTLPPDQVTRALAAGGPLQDLPIDPEKLKDMSLAVVEVDGEIVAYWVVWYALHVEPLWIQPAYRKHPAVVRGIVEAMQAIVEQSGELAAFCVIEQEHLQTVAGYATRLGFHPAPGLLYYLVLQPAPEPVEV